MRGSAELRAYSSLPRHQDCSYPILSQHRSHTLPPTDSDNNENLPPLTNSLISPPPSGVSTQQQGGSSENGDKPESPVFHGPNHQLAPQFRDRVHTSPLPMMARQRRYSPGRANFDRNQEVFAIGERFPPGGRGRGFLNRSAKSESDHDYRSHLPSSSLMDQGVHDGYSSSPTAHRRELMKHPKFSEMSQRSPDFISRKQSSDLRLSFSDDSSPTPIRSNVFVQHDDNRKSVTEENAKSLIIDEERRKSLLVKDDRTTVITNENQKLDERNVPITGIEPSVPESNSISVVRGNSLQARPRRHPLIRSSEVHSSMMIYEPPGISPSHIDLYHGLEYSGNSDSGGEIMATPPMQSRRFGGLSSTSKRSDEGPLEESPGPGGSSPASVRASSGDDLMDAEPLFRKVTIKKRRQETRRLVDGSGK